MQNYYNLLYREEGMLRPNLYLLVALRLTFLSQNVK